MNTYDNIFDIFEDVLSTDCGMPTLPEIDPIILEESLPCTPQSLESEPMEEPQTILEQPAAQGWALLNIRPDVKPTDTMCFIKVRSRDDPDIWNSVPETMYSSLRYTMIVSVDPTCLPEQHTQLVMAQVRVTDEHGAEIKKGDGESVIKGPKEFQNLEFNRKTGRLECEINIKWQSVSFHHAKRKFVFLVKLYDFANGTMQFLFDARSGSFLTFARRPKVSERKKVPEVKTAICKKRKINKEEEKSVYFQKFTALLDQLVTMKENLSEYEKQIASQIICEKFLPVAQDTACSIDQQ